MVEQTEQLVEEAVEEPKEILVIDSKYRKIILAAQRSKQLQRGANPRIDMSIKKNKPTRIAMKELDSDKIDWEMTKESKYQ